jgi:Bacteriophage tail assembly protein
MDAASDPSVNEIVVMAGAQLGKTEVILNIIGYHVAHDPAPILVVQPTGQKGMAETFSKDRLAPMLRDTPSLKGKVKDPAIEGQRQHHLAKELPRRAHLDDRRELTCATCIAPDQDRVAR